MKAIHNVAFWRDPQLAGVEIGEIRQSDHVFPDHAHEGIYAVGMMAVGGAYCLGAKKSHSLVAPGQIALINPSQVHSGVPVEGRQISYRMTYFDLRLLAGAADEIAPGNRPEPEFSAMVVADPVLWGHLQRLGPVLRGKGERLEKESAVMEVMAQIIAAHGNVAAKVKPARAVGKAIEQAKQYLAADLEAKISLADAAAAAGLSRYHFLRVFKRATGLPPHLFRTLRRIDRAKQLLRSGTPLVEVALSVGFTDQSHFANTFRRFTGATPGQYVAGFLPPSSRFHG